MNADFQPTLTLIREKKPLVHNITNYVVMNFTANVLLATGASPVMAHAKEEVEEMTGIASALVLNIGTLSPSWIEAMILAGKKANEKNIPVILDPVGAGATKYRTETAEKILKEVQVTVLRGNASEILALVSREAKTKGVDSTNTVNEVKKLAKDYAREKKLIVAVTGKIDYITNGDKEEEVDRGDPMMGKITGTGCAATAIIGAFLSVNNNYLLATTEALTYFGIAGEKAAEKTNLPGSYAVALIDSLFVVGS